MTSQAKEVANIGKEDGTLMNGRSDEGVDPEVEAELEYAKTHGDPIDPTGAGGGDDDSALLEQIRDGKIKLANRKPKTAEDLAQPAVNGVVNIPRSLKNRRQPRNGKGRGDPKKEGGGGKFTWGSPNKIYEEPAYLDPDDPNYDSDAQGNVTFDELEGEMSEEEMGKVLESIVFEYFSNGDVREALDSIKDLNLGEARRSNLIRMMITAALDRKPSVRELTSVLLAEAVARRVFYPADLARAFTNLLESDLPDLVLDQPHAAESVGNFIARAVADLALSSEFLNTLLKDKDSSVSNPHATEALDRAEVMLRQKRSLHGIWGAGGATKPVRYLVRQMQVMLQEYLGSEDAEEARRCLKELEVPHFHHELVFQAGVMSIEAMHDRVSGKLAKLLKELYGSGDLTLDAVVKGFERLYAHLPDLSIDVPPAYTLAERWTLACRSAGFLPDSVGKKLPQRGRKRFVSEGDGGRLKVIDVAHPLI